MSDMMRRFMPFISLMLLATSLASAQDAISYLLSRANSLRREKSLPAYSSHSALTAAARDHAAWMVAAGSISHKQDNGSGPRERAQNHGYPSNWVSENIYMGPNAQAAWTFWLNSPIHYAGLVSPYYNNIGIGTASGAGRHAFVLLFGNSRGRRPPASAAASQPAPPPAYVLGIDAVGNIMHQVRPGDTMGDIALIYGYTWEDIPYMLTINNMTGDDIRQLEIGSVFLVPPQDGTFTPTAAPPSQTPTPSAPAPTATAAIPAPPSPIPTRGLVIRSIPTQTLTPRPPATAALAPNEMPSAQAILTVAALIQVGIIAAASFALIQRLR